MSAISYVHNSIHVPSPTGKLPEFYINQTTADSFPSFLFRRLLFDVANRTLVLSLRQNLRLIKHSKRSSSGLCAHSSFLINLKILQRRYKRSARHDGPHTQQRKQNNLTAEDIAIKFRYQIINILNAYWVSVRCAWHICSGMSIIRRDTDRSYWKL